MRKFEIAFLFGNSEIDLLISFASSATAAKQSDLRRQIAISRCERLFFFKRKDCARGGVALGSKLASLNSGLDRRSQKSSIRNGKGRS